MDLAGIATLITAGVAATITLTTAIVAAVRATMKWARAQAKADLLQEQSAATINTLNAENAALKAEVTRLGGLRQENSP